jgi:hypothetical protein
MPKQQQHSKTQLAPISRFVACKWGLNNEMTQQRLCGDASGASSGAQSMMRLAFYYFISALQSEEASLFPELGCDLRIMVYLFWYG